MHSEKRIRHHLCFGSWRVPHLCDTPPDEIVGLILKVRAKAYSIESANRRGGASRLAADRILRFARLVSRENVIAGTDCGFAQTDFIQRVPLAVTRPNFEALVRGAEIATRQLHAAGASISKAPDPNLPARLICRTSARHRGCFPGRYIRSARH